MKDNTPKDQAIRPNKRRANIMLSKESDDIILHLMGCSVARSASDAISQGLALLARDCAEKEKC